MRQLILVGSQTTVAQRALARGGSGGAMSGGIHFGANGHFARAHFGHRLRKNPIFLGAYGWGWDWPYADYGETPAGYGNTTIVAFPPPLTAVHAADNCRWNAESFTVPRPLSAEHGRSRS